MPVICYQCYESNNRRYAIPSGGLLGTRHFVFSKTEEDRKLRDKIACTKMVRQCGWWNGLVYILQLSLE
jgi:hypothetical protein